MTDADAVLQRWGVPAGQHVRLPGRGTTFVREVAGPPGAPAVVLLHGLGATSALNWPGAYNALSPWFRVLAVDHRGRVMARSDRRRHSLRATAKIQARSGSPSTGGCGAACRRGSAR